MANFVLCKVLLQLEVNSALARHHSVVQLLILNSTRSKRASMSKHNPVAKAINYMVREDARWDASPIQWLYRRRTFFHATGNHCKGMGQIDRSLRRMRTLKNSSRIFKPDHLP